MHHPTNAEVPKVIKLRIDDESSQERRVPGMGEYAQGRERRAFSLEMATQNRSQRFELGQGRLEALNQKAWLPL